MYQHLSPALVLRPRSTRPQTKVGWATRSQTHFAWGRADMGSPGGGGGGGLGGEATGVAPPPPPKSVGESYSSSLLDRSAEYINNHLRAFRAIPWVVGGVGAVLFVRYSGMFTRFRRISDIPPGLLTDNSRLSGVVTGTHWDSIDVWHTPLGARLLRRRPPKPCPEGEVLRVGFAGVAVASPEAMEQWLPGLLGRRVWCTLLARDQRMVQCVVQMRRKWLLGKGSVNEVLISRGLGSVEEVGGFKSSDGHTKFMEAMRRREKEARGKGWGMWEGHQDEAVWRKAVRVMRKKRKS